MPIEIILPDATTTAHATWSGTVHTLLSDQGSNFTTQDGANIGNVVIVSFGNLTSDIASINSIRFYVNGITGAPRGTSAVVAFDLLNGSDSSYSYAENKTFTDTTLGTEQAGTERTTSDGSTAWTESDVNGLRMSIKCSSISNASSEISLDFLKIDVDYNAAAVPPPPTYDTTINNTHITSGNINVTSGNIFI